MPKKVVAALTSRNQEFQLAQGMEAEGVAARLGLELEVMFAEQNAIVQIHQVFERIKADAAARPVAVLIEPVRDEGMERLARNAVDAGIGWLPLNRSAAYLATLRARHPELPICGVATDQVEAGRIQGRQIAALLPRGGTALYLQGTPMSASEERRRGTEEVLTGTGITLRPLSAAWTEASGEKAVLSWLRLMEGSSEAVDLVACQNDVMAEGARRALQTARPDWHLPFLGMDGLANGGQQLVARKELAATIVMPSNAGRAVEIVSRWLESGVQPAQEEWQTPVSFPPETELRPGP